MKVVRNTQDQLILRSVPWIITITLCAAFLGVIAFGLSALFAGNMSEAFWGLLAIPAFLSIFIVAFVRRDEVMFDRSRDLIEMRHSTFFGRKSVKHRLSNLGRAKLESSRSENGMTYRIAIELVDGMDKGMHPLTPVYVSGNGAKRGVAAINDWLARDVDSRSGAA